MPAIQMTDNRVNTDIRKLSEIQNGERVRITAFDGGQGVSSRLNRFGIYPGDSIRILRRAPFGGPVLLEVRGMEIALSLGIASRILVEVVGCDSR